MTKDERSAFASGAGPPRQFQQAVSVVGVSTLQLAHIRIPRSASSSASHSQQVLLVACEEGNSGF